MSPKIWCFGDSWAYGSGLKQNQKPFIHWISHKLKLPYINVGAPANSLGIVVHDIVKKCHIINNSDIVFVIIPPDARWYDEDEENGFYPLTTNHKNAKEWINKKTLEWFTYHHAIFIYLIQKILNDIKCRYVLAHSYGKLQIEKYNLKIDKSKFASEKSLHALLTNTNNIELKDLIEGLDVKYCTGKFFDELSNHPNELGHKLIAKIMMNRLDNQ